MHEPHSSGVRRITRFVRVEVVVFILSIKRILQVVHFFVQEFCHDSKIAYFVQVSTLINLVAWHTKYNHGLKHFKRTLIEKARLTLVPTAAFEELMQEVLIFLSNKLVIRFFSLQSRKRKTLSPEFTSCYWHRVTYMFLQTVDWMLITEFSDHLIKGSLIDFVTNYPVLGSSGDFMIWWLISGLEKEKDHNENEV